MFDKNEIPFSSLVDRRSAKKIHSLIGVGSFGITIDDTVLFSKLCMWKHLSAFAWIVPISLQTGVPS